MKVAAAAALLLAATARAQFTSAYSYVTVSGNFNSYDTWVPRMRLISNGVWQAYVPLTNYSNPQFLFATTNFDAVWKESNQPGGTIPLLGTAEFNTGNDITLTTNITGTLRMRLNEASGAYSVFNVSFAEAGAGTPWINELHYDNNSVDANEGVEIAGPAGTSLTNFALYFYNGDGGLVYKTTSLSGTITNQLNGFGTLFFAIPDIQNGPDGLALVKDGLTVIQFLCYSSTGPGGLTALDGPANGLTATNIGVFESSSTTSDQSLQLTGPGGTYDRLTWTSPATQTRGTPNTGQLFPLAASVIASNLLTIPNAPNPTNTVQLQANLSPFNGASNLSATAFYRTNSAMRFIPLAMSVVSGNYYRTTASIPAFPAGTYVDYHIFVNFDGIGTNSPSLYPTGAPVTNATYGVSATAPGAVWINEFSVETDLFDSGMTNEFIEIAGRAGTDLANWTLECYGEASNRYATYRFPNPMTLANDASGYGFLLLADTNRQGVDIVFTNSPGSFDQLPAAGAFRLLDPVGVTIHAICYGANMSGFNLFAATYAGEDPQPGFSDYSVQMSGTGSMASAFTWTTNDVDNGGTPGAINPGQVLTGGNTNALPPAIVCPSNIFLSCISATVPPANTNSVVVIALCTNAATVTWLGDTTNGGTGCSGNPRLITRTYRAATACGTSTCQQIISIEDKTPPTMTWPTQAIVNAGFEEGTLAGWTTFGAVSNNITTTVAFPRSGFFGARIVPPVVARLYDSSLEAAHGMFYGTPTWFQAGASTGTSKSVRFDGVDDRADVAWNDLQNGTNFSFAFWAKALSGQGTYRSPLTARDDGPPRGYMIYASAGNTWDFQTGTGASDWHGLIGPAVTTGVWVHIAGVYDSVSRIKQLFINGTLYTAATNVPFAINGQRPLRIGAGATESNPGNYFFPGQVDDVQLYNYPLTPAQVTALYNVGIGGTEATNSVGRYRLDENPVALSRTCGVYQAISTATGQTWLASIHLAQTSIAPFTSNTAAQVALQFLGSTGAVVAATNAPIFDQGSPKDAYVRYAVRAVAPTNATSARLIVTYVQDEAMSPGTLYIDDATMTPFVVNATAGLSCAVMPDYRPLVTATDSCGPVVITQSPAQGSAVGGSNIVVTFTATDPCGLTARGSIVASVEDNVIPTYTAIPARNLTCVSDLPPPDPGRVSATDTCGSVTITVESSTIQFTGGCGATSKSAVYKYRITDNSGNYNICNEVFFIRDSNAPSSSCSIPDLTNGSFEAGTFVNWSPFGTSLYVTNLLPRSGTKHAVFYGLTNTVVTNFIGLYQDIPAAEGQSWRAAGFVLQPTSQALQGSNRVELKVEFLDATESNLDTRLASYFTSNSYRDVYVPISVTATAPVGSVKARCTVLLVQPNTPSNAPGTVYLDDFTLTRHMVSADPDICNAFYPDVMTVPAFTDACSVILSQLPLPTLPAVLGWNTNVVYAEDACGQKSQCPVNIYVVDDVSPLLISGPADVNVSTTNAVPPPDTNSVIGADTCGSVLVRYEGDTSNGGSGALGDPRIITRTYRVMDTFSNSVLHRQTITVEDVVPPAPTNVVVRSIALGTNLVIQSLGTNSWSVAAEYSTNLLAMPQQWTLLPPITNIFVNGTNITTFQPPVTNARPVLIRIRQQYP